MGISPLSRPSNSPIDGSAQRGSAPLGRAVFLDRDGTLNESVVEGGVSFPPRSAEEFRLVPGALAACRSLREAGFTLLVVTNQPDVARGAQTREEVERINARARGELPVDDLLTCYHDDADRCSCRKPLPGLLLEGARRWGVDLARSFMVGDRWSDAEAGRAAGCATVLIERGYSRKERCSPDWTAPDVAAAARIILSQGRDP